VAGPVSPVRRARAARVLRSGGSNREAADAARVKVRTINLWKHDPSFLDLLHGKGVFQTGPLRIHADAADILDDTTATESALWVSSRNETPTVLGSLVVKNAIFVRLIFVPPEEVARVHEGIEAKRFPMTMVEQLREIAERLGKETVSRSEFLRESGLTEWQVMKRFDAWNDLVLAAGLQLSRNKKLTEDELFEALRDAFIEGGGVGSRLSLRRLCRVSDSVYTKRFGRWPNVLARFREWVVDHEPDFPYLADLPTDAETQAALAGAPRPGPPSQGWSTAATRTRYGPFLNFRGLQHAPINEQGVVFLFGIVAFDLGYVVEGVGVGFPDCEAKRSVSKTGDTWERVRIEFEYRSRNFHEHGHDPSECDVLVCWEHNWSDCPLEVLELKSAIESLAE
jgi:hypothetical protein